MTRKMTSHLIVMRVKFDKPCTNAFAVAAVKDCVHGEFYPQPTRDWTGPDAFKIRGVTRLPKRCRREAA